MLQVRRLRASQSSELRALKSQGTFVSTWYLYQGTGTVLVPVGLAFVRTYSADARTGWTHTTPHPERARLTTTYYIPPRSTGTW